MALREKTIVKLRSQGNGLSHSRMDVTIRDLTFSIDEPEVRGGTNMGPAPTEAALAALAGCTNVIGNKCAGKLGVDIGHLSIEITCEFDRRGVTLEEEIDVPFVALRQVVTSDGTATEEDLSRVASNVAKYCPLSKLFEQSGTALETIWQKA
ncbi:putative OsmC-like protein [Labrenzia sp. EL_208]|uniref:OsmC family protein n=1 Tax=Roseibium album TaxID=311410 RepID=UPI001A2DC237|nr:OsmC family protein [Roseibium album]MBG6144813.1 putative OsmC-like protein [Labrenzia sp. EL_142]MBG6156970.1 putative OsmC-like protein [Labrenzia sp. EL_162]MBG6172220.1 putative OsmC-like protein [Labrenzia sp. EL_132]MBG6195089.1 putative OsmC-like protein [Labrenzia sp. EL_159]MBG6227562.1 putative OsmC-like protein [Labrenzia sp. EL_208]MCR9061002.1 OsmC family protein [Paracoccaceae bacterium]